MKGRVGRLRAAKEPVRAKVSYFRINDCEDAASARGKDVASCCVCALSRAEILAVGVVCACQRAERDRAEERP